MTNEEKQEAAELAKKASRQGKNAVRNGIKAVETVAEPAIESVAEEIHDTANKLNGTAEEAIHTMGMLRPKVLSRVSGDVTLLALELAMSAYVGTLAYGRFRKIRGFAKGYAEARETLATRRID